MLKNMSWAQIGFILRKFEENREKSQSILPWLQVWNSLWSVKFSRARKRRRCKSDIPKTPFQSSIVFKRTWSGNFWPLNRCLSIEKKYRTKSFGRMSPTNSETMRFGISRTVLSFVFFNCIYNISLFDHWNHIQHDQNMLSSVSLIPFNDDSELMNHKDRRLYVIIETVP